MWKAKCKVCMGIIAALALYTLLLTAFLVTNAS